MRRISVIVLLLFSLNVSADDCLKLVLGRYCLGGSIDDLLKSNRPWHETSNGTTRRIMFEEGDVMVSVVRGRIAYIGKRFKPGTYLTYRDTLTDLRRIYGKGVDRSYFPSYATNDSDQETAVVLGKGKGIVVWEPDGFRVSLSWTSPKYVVVNYSHNELSNELRENQEKASGSL